MAMIEGNKRPDDIEYDDEGLKKLAELNKNSMSDLFTSSDRFYLTMATNSDHYPFATETEMTGLYVDGKTTRIK